MLRIILNNMIIKSKINAIFLLILIVGCSNFTSRFNGESVVRNQYGLKIIDSEKEYLKHIELDSNNRMIDLEKFIPNVRLDIRYATSNNFTKTAVYDRAKALVRLPVATALLKVQKELEEKKLGLIIFDAYRPYSVTLKFWEMYKDTNFVAAPWTGSRHNRGCAVDVSVYDNATGKEIIMPTKYDDFSEKAHSKYSNLSDDKLSNRNMLIDLMAKHGFTVYETEWWHFDFIGYEKYDLLDLPFSELNNN
jgi:D-alanyl-D-alanine dipeptidase